MSDRVAALVVGLALLCGILTGVFGYAAFDSRRDARIEAEARARLVEVEEERNAARSRAAEAERDREDALRRIREDSVAWEQERRELRRTAERARVRGDSIAREIVALFPETEDMIRALEEEHEAEVAAERRKTAVAEEEIRSLREVGIEDARLIEALREEVSTADARAEAAIRSEIAGRQAAASREKWYKAGGGALLLLLALAAAS